MAKVGYICQTPHDDIWTVVGFYSRSSVFRILNKYGVKLNRVHFSGPLGKRKKESTLCRINSLQQVEL